MKAAECTVSALFDLERTQAGEYLKDLRYPWEALAGLGDFLRRHVFEGSFADMGGGVYVHRSAKVAETARISGPAVIGAGSEVRTGAFIRGSVLVGENCVVGNSTELKNCILFDGVQVPHYNYVGDSILGFRAHLGAGAVTSNLRADRGRVFIRTEDGNIDTGSRKCGAFLGDGVEAGCNAVLCPGTVVGRGTTIYPLTLCRGCFPSNCIVKQNGAVVVR